MSEYRLEVTLSESSYRGDRDERLTEFTVSSEGQTPQEAIVGAVTKMGALGYDPRLLTDIGLLTVDEVAKLFHECYEGLAPEYGYATRSDTAVKWEDGPEDNRNLMRATVAGVFDFLGIPLREPAGDTKEVEA